MTEPTPPDHAGSPSRERPAPARDGDRDRRRAPDPGASQSPHRPSFPPSWLPAALVALGVLLLAVSVRGVGGLDHGFADGPAHSYRPPVAIGAGLLLLGVATSYAKRRGDDDGILRRAENACAVLLGVAALLVPVGLFMLGRRPPPPPPLLPLKTLPNEDDGGATTGLRITPPPTPPKGKNQATPHWLTLVASYALYLIIAAILVVLVVVIINFLRRVRVDLGGQPAGQLGDAEDLAEAVAAASEALEYRGETREAVIACYAAMEQSIAEAGVGRHSSDTPEELLKRATAAGLVPVAAAARLTDLFREARYSRHPMTDTHRAEARVALALISAHLLALRPPENAGAVS